MPHSLLVVETDIAIRHPLAEYLRECGYKVVEAVSTDEAMSLLTAQQAKVDAILTDVKIGGAVDGFGLAKWVREKHPQVEVILAGTVERIVQEAGELCEEGPSLKKPYHHTRVLDEIRRRLAGRERNSTG